MSNDAAVNGTVAEQAKEQEKPQVDVATSGETKAETATETEQTEVAEQGFEEEEEQIELKPVLIKLPAPTYGQTVPPTPVPAKDGQQKSTSVPTPTTFVIHPQPFETIQDIKATLAEWIGGYWLGPYSLRVPSSTSGSSSKSSSEEKRGKLLSTGREGIEIREGEKLSDWLEIGEVFGHVEDKEGSEAVNRVLVVQKEPYSEQEARSSVLRLREYTMPASEAAQPFPTVGIQPGATIFEGIRDGTLSEGLVESNVVETAKPANATKDKKQKSGKKLPQLSQTTEADDKNAPFATWTGWPQVQLDKLPISLPLPPHTPVLKSLIFSPFNPPPAHLRQQGHLVYLTVVTLEGESAMLVCTTRGWHVARSTAPSMTFDPQPRPKSIAAHSLIDLLHGLSPAFTAALRGVQTNGQGKREPIATVGIPQYPPAYPWLATPPTDRSIAPDLLRTQIAYGLTGATSADGLEAARDWNEELQNAREMPKSNPQERLLRERVLQKTHAEFTAACSRGAMAIARGDLLPINPHEDNKSHMYMANNIFFTKGNNSVDAYTHLGGDIAAYVTHGKDAAGVKLLNRLDLDNVFLLGHAIIDWQGERWICQSVLPGIFSRRRDEPEEGKEGEESAVDNYLIIYGADSEGGPNKLHWDSSMHNVMKQIAQTYHLAAHDMTDSEGKTHEFWTSVDVKGLRGADGRRYLLDLPRLSPVDIEWLDNDMDGYPHRMVLLRPQLLESHWEHELKIWARKIQEEDKDKDAETKLTEEALKDHKFNLSYNPDAFVDQPLEEGDAENKSELTYKPATLVDEAVPSIKAVRDASKYLRNVVIPAVVLDIISSHSFGIMDGASLARHMHSRGINIRYLGHLLKTVNKFLADAEGRKMGHLEVLKSIIVREMLFRACKHSLRAQLNGLSAEHSTCAVSHFLNCLFASPNAAPVYESFGLGVSQPSYMQLTSEGLRKQIIDEVDRRYRWRLDDDVFDTVKKNQLLREIASRFGFQLKQQQYFELSSPVEPTKKGKTVATAVRTSFFEPSDIVTLIPVIKSCAPPVAVAEEVLDTGRATINRGNIQLGLDLMLEGINMYEQIHQVLHPEVAAAYNHYAVAMHSLVRLRIQQLAAENPDSDQPLGLDISTAIRLQNQAIMIAERTQGIHHAETTGYYFNLAMLENLQGDQDAALRYLKHVLSLWDVIYGEPHPELPSIAIHVAMILQTKGQHATAISLLNDVYSMSADLFGSDHLLCGTAKSQLTQAHFLNGDLEEALKAATESAEIFSSKLGAEDQQTKEAQKNVELLKNAVEYSEKTVTLTPEQMEKLKAMQAMVAEQVEQAALPAGTAAAPIESGATPEGPTEEQEAASRADLDQIVRYIQGQSQQQEQQNGTDGNKQQRGKNALRGKRRTGAKR